jgi:hypothetical protein
MFVRRSSFVVRRSSFVVRCSVRRSSFVVRFVVRCSMIEFVTLRSLALLGFPLAVCGLGTSARFPFPLFL